MKVHTRACPNCGSTLEGTRTRSEICKTCADANRLKEKFDSDRVVLEQLGYSDLKDPHLNSYKQRVWTFTHKCGHEQTSTFNNLMTRCKKLGKTPCSGCGG